MTTTADSTPRHLAARERSRLARNALNTLPVVLAGSLALSMNLTGPIQVDAVKRPAKDKPSTPSEMGERIRQQFASVGTASADAAAAVPAGEIAVAAAPSTYVVVAGDTVSGIAGRYGLSTASVLALNGLGWKSVIHPGQTLVLSNAAAPIAAVAPTPAPTASGGRYMIVRGDTISGIAGKFGVTAQAVLSANGLGWKSIIYPGQTLAIPGAASVATAAAPPAAAPAPPAAASGHKIVSGDTISSIAKKFGVSVSALLSANQLQQSSIIYAGKTLVIPSAATTAVGTPVQLPATASSVVPMTAEMEGHARTIVSVGRSLGVSDYGIVIALAAAAQESTLRNLNWGDLDSVGLFQQRPTAGWGTVAQLTTPEHSARLFYGGPSNPNKGITRGLLEISGWQNMTVTQAAQAVQISAHPDAYAKWEGSARAWLAQIG